MVSCFWAMIAAFEKLVGASQCSAVRVQFLSWKAGDGEDLLLLEEMLCVFPFDSFTALEGIEEEAICSARPLAIV